MSRCSASAVSIPPDLQIPGSAASAFDPAISGVSPNYSGWVAIVYLRNISSLGGTCVPSQFTMTVTDPGFDTSGNPTTVNRTITGVAQLRRQYPNGNSKVIGPVFGGIAVYITLDDWIYTGTTINSYTIGATFYSGYAGSTGGSIVNSSTTSYTKPVFAWLNDQQDYFVGNSYATEAVAFHRHARSGQQVACMKFTMNDGTTTTPEVVTSAPTTSALITIGNIPEVWKATLNTTTMAVRTMCTVNAKVYPWIGDQILDLSVDGYAWPTSLPITKLRVFSDRDNTYTGGFAYVDGTGAAPAVSGVAATARLTPYATIAAAATAGIAWMNANKTGHTPTTGDLGGFTIRLMDDGAAGPKTHNLSGNVTNSPGLCWCEIERDPLSAGVVTVTDTAQSSTPQLTRWGGKLGNTITLQAPAAAVSYCILGYGEQNSLVSLRGVTCDNTNNKLMVAWHAYKYLNNITLTGTNGMSFQGLPVSSANVVCMNALVSAVNTAFVLPSDSDAKVTIGCVMPLFGARLDPQATGDGNHGTIFYNNRVNLAVYQKTSTQTINNGFAVVQNLFESATTIPFRLFADGDLSACANVIEMHNTSVGERTNMLYNDTTSSKVPPNGIQKLSTCRYSIYGDRNWKGDTFPDGVGDGSVGTWTCGYGVGQQGVVSLFGSVNEVATDAPHNDNLAGPFMGMAWTASSEYNLFRTALGFTKPQIMAMFTNFTVAPQAVPALGGDYTPVNTATQLKNRVPAGLSVLLKDIAGATRKTDGTGAAGAYEAAP
jgi:hypothetical protein